MNNFNPKIVIPESLDKIIAHLTKEIGIEFTLFGKTKYEDGAIRLLDIRVPEQISSGADTEISTDSLEKFMEDLLNDNEDPKDWNMWIHSHNTMGAFWSGTDMEQMSSFNTGGPDYFAHMVVSTRGRKAALSQYRPFNLLANDIEIEIVADDNQDENPRINQIRVEAKGLQDRLAALTKEYDELTNVIPQRARDVLAEVNSKNKTKQQFLPLNDNKNGKKGNKGKHKTDREGGLSDLSRYYDEKYNDSNERFDDADEYGGWHKPTGLLKYYEADKSWFLPENYSYWLNEHKRLTTAVTGHRQDCSCKECEMWLLSRKAMQHYNEIP